MTGRVGAMSSSDDGCGYDYSEDSVVNSRGMRLFTCTWIPTRIKPKPRGVICICHGYAVECSVTMRGTAERLARAGYAVYGIDYEGHGRSDGLQGYVPDFDALVRDCDAFFSTVAASFPRRFLLGESMGGAVALLLHRVRPDFWTGAIFVAPMCKIAEEMRPHPLVVSVLKAMTSIIPTWRVVPTNDVIDLAYRMQGKRDEIRGNPLCYKGRPRLKTAYELLRVSLLIESTILPQVSLPFLVVHGAADRVTDPSVSDLLYRSAASTDKTFNLYTGMWHALTSGELPDNIDAVFRDIIDWLHHRTTSGSDQDDDLTQKSTSSETERKAKHDDSSRCGKQTL